MNFLFKYPTRNRPNWFMQTLKTYYSMLSRKNPYRFLITLDEDDETMNNNEMRIFMDGFPNLVYKYGDYETKIEAINADMEGEEFDILFLVSDDMIPIVCNFDNIIAERMKRHFPNLDGALHFPDGFCNESKDSAITLSIMGKKLYDRFGYIYHPDYKSFFCDTEFRDVVYRMNKAIYIPKVIVNHQWKGQANKRDTMYIRNTELGRDDRQTYKRRKAMGFPK